MITAADTNALLAILYDDEHAEASEAALRAGYSEGRLVVAPIVRAELAADGHFEEPTALEQFFADMSIAPDRLSDEAVFTAGERFREYLERRPDGLQCPACGALRSVDCPECGGALAPRQHVAADFLIGAHAERDADALISFDAAFYDTYFPDLAVHPR